MKRTLMTAAGVLGAAMTLGAAGSAQAALTLNAGNLDCNVFSATGCLFDIEKGDGGSFDDPAAFEAAYNAAHVEGPPPAVLDVSDFLDKIDLPPEPEVTSYFVDLPDDFLVSFYSVKFAGSVLLFGLDTPVSEFTAVNTFNGQAISHVTWYGSICTDDCGGGGGTGGIPEPATWAMMIMGFGAAGTVLRRRRTAIV